jgi:hypothetical protein
MKPSFFGCQYLFGFNIVGIGHATIYRAYGRTLGFLVKPGALGTLSGYDIIELI